MSRLRDTRLRRLEAAALGETRVPKDFLAEDLFT